MEERNNRNVVAVVEERNNRNVVAVMEEGNNRNVVAVVEEGNNRNVVVYSFTILIRRVGSMLGRCGVDVVVDRKYI